MQRIQRLSSQLANQIAAGEVIERPASIVKELVENSIDAGATRIEITLNALLTQLCIEDNGCGIVPEDLLLAIAPHATSKLQTAEDLWKIQTLGFRGEALASIASIAKVTLISRAKGEETAWQLKVIPESEPVMTPTARSVGTTVWIEDCFFNVPVRRRFLKSIKTELSHIVETMTRYALRYPEIGFFLKIEQRYLLQAPSVTWEQYAQRLVKLLNKNFVDNAHYLEALQDHWTLKGWVSQESGLRRQADWQYWFLNGRPVRDRVLLQALRQVYQGSIQMGYHPACVLFLELPTEEVDVNVHPTKHEVRFCQASAVHTFISEQLRAVLAEPVVPDLPIVCSEPVTFTPLEMDSELRIPLPPLSVPTVPIASTITRPNTPPLQQEISAGLWWQDFWLTTVETQLYLVTWSIFERWALQVHLEQALMMEGKLATYPLLFPESQVLTLEEQQSLAIAGVDAVLNRFGFYYQVIPHALGQQCRLQTHAQGVNFQDIWGAFWRVAKAGETAQLGHILEYVTPGGLMQWPRTQLQTYLKRAIAQGVPGVVGVQRTQLVALAAETTVC